MPVRSGEGEPSPWIVHGWFASAFLLVATFAAVLLGSPDLPVQVMLLAAGVALLGVPHGALDGRIGERLLRPVLGRRWLPVFLIGYMGLVAIVMAGWRFLPGATLALFLLLSVGHFGAGDAREQGAARAAEVVTRGAAPILLPALAWPAEVAQLFAWVSGDAGTSAALVGIVSGPVLAIWFACTGVTVARAFGRGDRLAVVELIAVALAFLLLPPLLAFAAYFCVLHSARALIASAPPGSGSGALPRLIHHAAPFSAATVAIVLLAYLAGVHGEAPSASGVQAVFQWLAALTVPHLTLGALVSTLVNARGGRMRGRLVPNTDLRNAPLAAAGAATAQAKAAPASLTLTCWRSLGRVDVNAVILAHPRADRYEVERNLTATDTAA